MTIYRGYIYRWGLRTTSRGDIIQAWDKLVRQIPGVTILTRYPSAKGNSGEWLVGVYESKLPVSDTHIEHPDQKNKNGLYEYPVLFRATRQGTVVIGSSGTKIVNHFSEKYINSQSFPELVPMRIRVKELANHLILEDRDKFAVSSLSVNVDAAGENLVRADYHGADLAAAALIYENLKYQTAFLIGLKSRGGPNTEIIRVGSRGYIQLSISDNPAIEKIESILSFLWGKYYQ